MNEARILKFSRRSEPGQWHELTPREREMCILHVVHNLSYKEIAALLRVTRSDVAYHLRTAMRVLRVCGSVRLAYWMGLHSNEIFGEAEKGS